MMRLVAVAFALLVGIGTAQAQQGYKVGFVNTETVLKELPEANEASKKIEEVGVKWRDTLQIMQKDFETRVEAYRKQESLMSADAKRKEEESLGQLRNRLLAYNDEKFGATGEVARLRQGFLTPIQEKVKEAINAVAKEEKLNLVLDKVAGIVLFSEEKADITYKVLDKLKRGSGK